MEEGFNTIFDFQKKNNVPTNAKQDEIMSCTLQDN